MKKFLILLLIPFISSCAIGRMSPEVENLLKQGDEAYKKGLTAEDPENKEFFFRAAMLMEKAAETGKLKNGYLDYNIGNSWMSAGETGQAVYYLRRALKRIPGNSLVSNSLKLARDSVQFSVQAEEPNPLIRALLFFHFDLSLNTRYIILIIALSGISLLMSFRLFRKSPILMNSSIILAVIAVLFIASITVDALSPRQGVILDKATGRKGDSPGYENSFNSDLPPGIEFSLMEKRGGWWYIKLRDGRTCWIDGESAKLIE